MDRNIAAWPRRQQLLKDQLLGMSADIVCLQEVSDKSFQSDFDFMQPAGYTAIMHEKTGRMRPATFYRSKSWEQVLRSTRDQVGKFKFIGPMVVGNDYY
eukprot:5331639-Amphidinium_carterae.1